MSVMNGYEVLQIQSGATSGARHKVASTGDAGVFSELGGAVDMAIPRNVAGLIITGLAVITALKYAGFRFSFGIAS